MKSSANRAIETFLIITFPLALFAGCAGNGETKPADQQAMAQETVINDQGNVEASSDSATASTMKLLADTINAVKMSKDTTDSAPASEPQEQALAEDSKPSQDPTPAENQTIENIAVVASNTQTGQIEEKTQSAATPLQTVNDNLVEASLNTGTSKSETANKVSEPDLHIINFDTDKADVNNHYLAELQQHALFLKANPDLTLTISGHTDSTGSHAYNEKLSLKRAQAIYKILLSDGAPESQLMVDSYGDTSPLHSKGNYQENRRVELEYLDAVKMHLSVR